MNITCTDNSGFEDQLANDRIYKVKEIRGGSYLIENDQSQVRWYGSNKFSVKIPA